MVYGPGFYFGSNGTDDDARKLLEPLADTIGRNQALDRYRLVLHLLEKKALDKSSQYWQDAALVVQLRNEIVHYKSALRSELDRKKFLKALRTKKHARPPFVSHLAMFFPEQCLNAACARWAVRSSVRFLDRFYERLGFPDRLDPYRAQLP